MLDVALSERPGAILLAHGARVDAKYELVECLGEGGMGTVWSARHVSLGHAVAIKFLQGATHGDDARARFEREARIAARLGEASRHIARVIDHGVLHDVTPYLVMELLHGETLSARLKRRGHLSLSLAARLTLQLCRALQAAHLAGVIHRDLKPANIFLCASETDDEVLLKLMDFGVAKATRESDDEPTTRAGLAVGTPSYMSPEQILCKRVDTRSDLWGVAAVVYRMVTGRSPFGNGGIAELGLRILATDPARPSSFDPTLPRAFDSWIEKALAKNPEERFQSARDLADALATVAGLEHGGNATILLTPIPMPSQVQPYATESISAIHVSQAETRVTQAEGLSPQIARRARETRKRGIWLALGLASVAPLALAPAVLPRTRAVAEAMTVAPPPTSVPNAVTIATVELPPPSAALSAPASLPVPSAKTAAARAAAPLPAATAAPNPAAAPTLLASKTSAVAPPSVPSPPSAAVPAPRPTTLRNQASALWQKRDEL
jgi:serine/threonine-protein kinase